MHAAAPPATSWATAFLALGIALAVPARASAAPSTFGSFFETLYGYYDGYSWYPEVGDLDGDGKDDLVRIVAYNGPAQIIVRFGEPDGRLSGYPLLLPLPPALDYQYGDWPCIHDLDGDGIPDIVIGDPAGLFVLRGLGNRTFAPAVTIADPCNGYVSSTDFNGDGVPDYACVGVPPDSVRIRFGSGNLAFAPGPTFPIADGYDVHLLDFDGDGRLDVYVGGSPTSKLLLSQGGGTFLPFDVPAPWALPAGDLNGDGFEDLFSLSAVFLGHGDGTFSGAIPHGVTNPQCTADLNEDGKPDLIGVRDSSALGRTEVRLGRGDGTFGPPIFQRTTFASTSGGVATGDFDQDGHTDLVIQKWNSDSEVYMFGTGTGTFRQNARIYTAGPTGPVLAGRLGDGPSPDLVLFRTGTSSFAVMLSQGLADYAALVTYAAPATYSGFAMADLNGDGRDDLVAAYSGLATISAWLAQPGGSLGPRIDTPTASGSLALAVADFDGDGTPDMVTSVNGGNGSWLHGNGDGTFGPAHALPGALGNQLVVADLDRNGLPDIVSGGSFGVRVMLASGVGTYGSPSDYGGALASSAFLAAGTFDSDTLPDIVTATDSVRVLHGTGAGALGTTLTLSTVPPQVKYAGDANGDGLTDLVANVSQASAACVCFGTETMPGPVVGFGVAFSVTGVTLADVDGNGAPDLVANTNYGLTVLFNQTITPNVGVEPPAPARAPTRLAVRATPNPVRAGVALRLELAGFGPVEVRLYDLAGRRVGGAKVERPGARSVTVPIEGSERLAPGVYLVRARQGSETATARVCVMR